VKLIEKDYPLDPECNANTPGGQHQSACEAAAAVRLAAEHGKAAEMEAWLYDNQAMMTPALVRQGARDVGKVTDFDARYQRVLELVKGDIALGAQLGVRATPTFFINGVRIPGLRAEFFDAAIAYELKQAGVIH
jgi:protein-disulfide isomerase